MSEANTAAALLPGGKGKERGRENWGLRRSERDVKGETGALQIRVIGFRGNHSDPSVQLLS